jgi:hypothetical protein
MAVAVAVLNASDTIASAAARVSLVRSLRLEQRLPLEQLNPEPGDLLALLLDSDLLKDEAATFLHYRQAGWGALEPALLKSQHIEEFFAPELVQGMVGSLYANPELARRLGRRVVERLAEYVPEEDGRALVAAARFALAHGLRLPVDQVRRVAAAGLRASEVLPLLGLVSPAPTPQDVVSIFGALGEPYSYLATRAKSSFEVPDDDDHKWVLQLLSDAGLCSAQKKRNKPKQVVKLA